MWSTWTCVQSSEEGNGCSPGRVADRGGGDMKALGAKMLEIV